MAQQPSGATQREAGPAPEQQLYDQIYKNIVEYHIDHTRPEILAMAALNKLPDIDSDLSIKRRGSELIVQEGATWSRFALPAAQSSAAWGHLTAVVLRAARRESPEVRVLPRNALDETVIDAALASLDPYSRYVGPEIAREHRAERDGFGGIGVTVDVRPAYICITSVMPGTPAAAAGLAVDDRILALDGVPASRLSPDQVGRRLRGAPHSLLTLKVAPADGGRARLLQIERKHIVEPTVTLDVKDGIATLKIKAFNETTAALATQMLKEAHRQMGPGFRGIVLDLRNNPGGLLDQAVELADLFLQDAPIASTVGRVPQSFQKFNAPAADHPETVPVVVLINGGSASASEILASSLQDSGRAVVIGTASYGKGTVQTVLRTVNDGELTVTWAQIITAGGYHLNHHGVVPTICTSGMANDAAFTERLLHGTTALPPAELDKSRKGLTEAGWMMLRDSCPAQRVERRVDLQIARRLIDNPILYSQALEPLPATTTEAKLGP